MAMGQGAGDNSQEETNILSLTAQKAPDATNDHMSLKTDASSVKHFNVTSSWGGTMITALKKTNLNWTWVPNPHNMGENKCACFKPLNLW